MKYLTLLFLSLLCTCVSAQKIAPSLPAGSGSMIVDIGTGVWEVSISSETLHQTHKFVSEKRYRESPGSYAGYEIVKSSERYDLRMIHKLVNQRLAAGWQLLSTKHSLGVAVLDYDQLVQPEVIYYAFSVPDSSTGVVAESKSTLVKTATVTGPEANKLRGMLLQAADSTFTLLIEEKVGPVWLEYYRLHNAGLVAEDGPSMIESIVINRQHISFNVKLHTGWYRYNFTRWQNKRYFLSGLWFQPNNECGLQSFNAKLSSGVVAICTGHFRRQECIPGEKEVAYEARVEVREAWLDTFVLGTRRIELKSPKATVFY
jgi:hypothetical protein